MTIFKNLFSGGAEQILPKILSPLLIAIAVPGLIALASRDKAKKNTVRLPRIYTIIGLICLGLFLFFTILAFRTAAGGTGFFFLGLCLISGLLVLAGCNSGVRYDINGFTARNFLGFSRRYTYGELTGIRGKTKDITLFAGSRRIRLDSMMTGREEFLAYARNQYRKTTGHALRTLPASHRDLFQGNIENPGEFIAVYILLLVFVIGASVFVFTTSLPKQPEEWDRTQTVYTDWFLSETGLLLKAEDFEGYYHCDCETAEARILLEQALERGEHFDAAYMSYKDKEGKPYRTLKELVGARGEVYLSAEDSMADEWREWRKLCTVFGGIVLIFVLYLGLSIYVGRHPERFRPKFVYAFFKPEYVLYDFDKKKNGA